MDKTSCNRDALWLRSHNVRDEQVIETESQGSDDVVVEEIPTPTVFVTDCV